MEAFACGCIIFELLGVVERGRERERVRRCVFSGVLFAFLRIEEALLVANKNEFHVGLAWLEWYCG